MSKTILVLTGSPRQGGNSDIMAEAFIQGAQSRGHRILRFDAGRKNVTGCVACKTCFSTGHPCSWQDDFEEFDFEDDDTETVVNDEEETDDIDSE